MAYCEAPHRLSDAIEAFKADLNGNLRASGALATLRVCPLAQSHALTLSAQVLCYMCLTDLSQSASSLNSSTCCRKP